MPKSDLVLLAFNDVQVLPLFERALSAASYAVAVARDGRAVEKILQEAITLTVFVPISILYMKESIKQDYLWASLFILAAVFFMFRGMLVK